MVRLLPPRIAMALLAVSAGLHLLLTRGAASRVRSLTGGTALFAAGFGLMIWAWALFRRKGTAIRPTDQATTIVSEGPYRFSRNPMYLGIVAMLLGIAWAVGTWPFLIAPAGFIIFMSTVFIPYEEKRLEAAFGEAYAAYRKRVRRWI